MVKHVKLDLSRLRSLAQALAKDMDKSNAVVGLIGQLGSGKTTFSKFIGSTLGSRNIKSPTFTVISEHKTKSKKTLYHIDLYRLYRSDQLKDLGLDEIISSKNRIVLIEWADRFPKVLKKCNMIIHFKIIGDKRNVLVQKK